MNIHVPCKIDRKYDKNGKEVFICSNCGKILLRIKKEVQTIRLVDTCPKCMVKLDWSVLF
jgi:predicted RNA-binding Zn-ribbon protein involved in translation (DUF1610 family)